MSLVAICTKSNIQIIIYLNILLDIQIILYKVCAAQAEGVWYRLTLTEVDAEGMQ